MSREIQVTVETITPDIAREMLGHNERNRNSKSGKIQQYARDMASGNWVVTGEAIKFDTAGVLLDGQNRLFACIAADTPFETMVMRGVPAVAQEFMDTGAARNAGDALTLRGYTNVNPLAAIARTHSSYAQGIIVNSSSGTGGRGNMTVHEVVEYVKEHPELVEVVSTAKAISKHEKVPLGVGPIGTAMLVTSQIDAEASEEFFTDLLTGRSWGVGDPTTALREKALSFVRNRQTVRSGAALFLLFRTWNAVRDDQPLRFLRLGQKEDGRYVPFPLPTPR